MTSEHEKLLQFLYLCPVGVAEVSLDGRVDMLNALAIQLLMPVAGPDNLDNLFELLRRHAPEILEAVVVFEKRVGTICDDRRVRLQQTEHETWFSFTIRKVDGDNLLVAFSDITATVLGQLQTQKAVEQEAVQKGKLEIASGVLHDVGNAVTGVGTRVARMLSDSEWEECHQLQRLGPFLEQQGEALQQALGPAKARALQDFVASIEASLEERRLEYCNNLKFLTRALAHVQEVLNIQRLYVRHTQSAGDLRELISDSLLIQQGSLEKRQVRTAVECPRDLPACSLDRTRFLQVLVNLIKNACESFDQCAATEPRELRFSVRPGNGQIHLCVSDNGAGYAPATGTLLFTRGETTKTHGSGHGLANCRQIVASHGGTIEIASPGPGLGASVTITLPIRPERKETPDAQHLEHANSGY